MPEFAVFREEFFWTLNFVYSHERFKFSSTDNSGYPHGWPSKTKWIKISKLIGAELIIDNEPVSKFKRAAVGTLVFGGIGTIAGLVSGYTASPKAKISVALQMDDFDVASFTTRCYNIGTAYRVLNTLAKMEKDYYDNNPSELKEIGKNIDTENDSANNNVFSEEIMKLKKMLDDGVIDEDEFKAFKKRLLDK